MGDEGINHVGGEATAHTRLLRTPPSTYHEGCPGCAFDRRKAALQGTFPLKDLSLVALLSLSNSLPICSLFSYVYYMVRDLGIAKADTQIGTYSGYLGSALLLGRFLMSTPWGMVADRYGHKPVILLGTTTITNYWMALVSRFFLGIGNGMTGTLTAYASEICRLEHQTIAMSVIGTMWGVGLIIGPAIGGYLAQETVHKHGQKGGKLDNKVYIGTCDKAGLSPLDDYMVEVSHSGLPGVKKSLWRNRALVATITVLSFWVLHSTSYAEVFSLWALSPEYYGGLEFTTSQVADVLALSGLAILIFQLLVFPLIANAGPIQLIRVSAALTTILITTYPLFPRLQGKPLWAVVILASVVKNILSTISFTGAYILINNSVGKAQRGVANGVSTSFMSGFQAVGPTLAGAIFSWSEERMDASFLPGMWMVFSLLGILSSFPLLATLKRFLPPSLNNPLDEG